MQSLVCLLCSVISQPVVFGGIQMHELMYRVELLQTIIAQMRADYCLLEHQKTQDACVAVVQFHLNQALKDLREAEEQEANDIARQDAEDE